MFPSILIKTFYQLTFQRRKKKNTEGIKSHNFLTHTGDAKEEEGNEAVDKAPGSIVSFAEDASESLVA